MSPTDLAAAVLAALDELDAQSAALLRMAGDRSVPMGIRVASTDQGRAFGDAAEIVRRAIGAASVTAALSSPFPLDVGVVTRRPIDLTRVRALLAVARSFDAETDPAFRDVNPDAYDAAHAARVAARYALRDAARRAAR